MTGRVWGDLRALAGPVAAYWATLALSFSAFSAAILIVAGWSTEVIVALSYLAAVASGAVAFGQACALLRLRTWAVAAAGMGGGLLLLGLTVVTSSVPAVAALLGIALFLFPFFALSGWWSLTVHGALLATFAPITFFVGAILTVVFEDGGLQRWQSGDKWAIWDGLSLAVLALAVASLLAFLAFREGHRLHHWQNHGADALVTQTRRSGSRLMARLSGCGTVAAIAALGLALTIGTALLAPYLWRTGPSDRGEPAGTESSESTERGARRDREPAPYRAPAPRPARPLGCGNDPAPTEPAPHPAPAPRRPPQVGEPMSSEQMQEAAEQAGLSLLFLLLFAVLGLLALALFLPPLRRTWMLAHLRRPMWPVPPTRHVQQSWWLLEVAIGDLAVPRSAADTPATLVRRAVDVLPGDLHLAPLLEVVAVYDRARFGLGMQPDDTDRARRQAEMAYEAIWSHLTEWEKVRAIYRWV
jgi:hypothetical protein